MRNKHGKIVLEIIQILKGDGTTLRELGDGRWETSFYSPMSGVCKHFFRSWIAAADHHAYSCQSPRLYEICAGNGSRNDTQTNPN